MKHKSLFVAAIAILLVLGLALLASGQSMWQRMGEVEQQGEKDGEQTVIAFIQGEELTIASGFLESSYYYYQQTLEPHDETWVKEHFVAIELLYREAQALGLEASPEVVDNHIAFLREDLQNTPESYEALLDYQKGRGMTEDEHWEETWELYQRQLSIEKLGEKLNNDYFSQHPGATDDDYNEYYRNEYLPQLFDKYQVEML